MMDAPCSTQARATGAFMVSTDTGTSTADTTASTTWRMRESSSRSETGVAPGRVDSAPMSMMSAPSATSSRA